MGILDREARKVRATVVPNVKRETLQNRILNEIERGSKLYTDQAVAYDKMALAKEYTDEILNHLEGYVNGRVHTNGLENFWSLLKRGLHGTYVAVEPFHLFRYVDEQVFRYNNRATKDNPLNDSDRFHLAIFADCGEAVNLRGGDWQGGRNGELALGVGSAGSGSVLLQYISFPLNRLNQNQRRVGLDRLLRAGQLALELRDSRGKVCLTYSIALSFDGSRPSS